MTSFSNLALYSLTIQPPAATQEAIVGDFIGGNKQQILSANGSRLSISEATRRQNGFREIFSQDVFGIIRHIAKFRLAGGDKDLIAISTDSGRLVTYEYVHEENKLKTVHFETFGKSGIRRIIPGEHLAVDPKGRAIMVASLEKNKLVYILTRSGQTDIAISSPLEAHKPQTLVYHLIGLDVGYDNPVFAALELDYSSSEIDSTGEAYSYLEKELVYYELDLGLNHIVRKWSEPVDRTSNMLFRVPGGPNAPSGVLCCGEDNISYRRIYNNASSVQRLAIPRREGATENPNRKRVIVAGTLYTLKGGDFFYLLQTDDGDVFKVTFQAPNGVVQRIKIKYFDTIPVASSICILKAGFVYCACESGDRILYELESLGEESDDAEFDSSQFPVKANEEYAIPFFKPRPLRNLTPIQTIPSMTPIMGTEVANFLEEDAPQIYSICGTGARSTFRTTRNALEVNDLIESQLPQDATGVWTTKLNVEEEHDHLIILCLLSRTLILKIGDDVEQASNTGFLVETNTLGVQQFGEDCIIQIHSKGIRHIRNLQFLNEDDPNDGQNDGLTDWQTPAHRTIVAYAANNRQVAIALSSGEIYYFECDEDGSLAKAEDELALESNITCLAMPDVPEGELRAYWLAAGCSDQSIRIYNVSPDIDGNILGTTSLQQVSAAPSSLAICYMADSSPRGESQYLHIGLRSGVYIRSELEEHTGAIGESRRRFLGPAPVRFSRVTAADSTAILAITSRPWLIYTDPHNLKFSTTPLDYSNFDSAWSFDGTQFKGIICVSRESLRIFQVNDVSSTTAQHTIPLQYTPRKLVGYPEVGLYYVIESDNNTMDATTRKMLAANAEDDDEDKMEESDDENEKPNGKKEEDEEMEGVTTNGDSHDGLAAVDFGHPKAAGMWASCIQVIDPVTQKAVVSTINLSDNKTALSAALISFESRDGEVFLAVGAAKGLTFAPKLSWKSASIQLYKVSRDGRSLEFYHETTVADPPMALLAFKGKLLAGIGRNLCMFDCGKKSLLRKAQTPNCVPTRIIELKTQGSRLIVADQSQSITYVVHKDLVHPNRLIPFADDTVPRWTTSIEMVDYDTVVGGDKFGNLWMLRCPEKISIESDESIDGQHLLQEKSYLGGAPKRLDMIMHSFANDIPVSIQKISLIAGGEKVIFWAGLQGTLGVLVPFQSRREFKMFQQLELILRNDEKPISGRDHLAYRSYYTPVKGAVDGDLIERFLALPTNEREQIVGQLNGSHTSEEVERLIWSMRNLYAF